MSLLEKYLNKNVFIRTVTMYHVGKLVEVTPQEYMLQNASWVADTGKFQQFLEHGKASDIEHFTQDRLGEVIGNRSAIIDVVIWPHDLPSSVR
jgi:vancomycin permeability regulator SanA